MQICDDCANVVSDFGEGCIDIRATQLTLISSAYGRCVCRCVDLNTIFLDATAAYISRNSNVAGQPIESPLST
jgi:hypothetical protein